jgi:sugar (pentulose or hexulose) kinase
MKKYNRMISQGALLGGDDAQANEYNNPAGAKKIINVGPVLLPIPTSTGGTTNATTAVGLPALGKSIAVYNNSGSVGSITLGTSAAVTSVSAGVVNSAGQAGIACPPNAWTYISLGNQQFVVASAATLLVYMIEDYTILNPA